MIEAKSVLSKALTVTCPTCQAPIGELCKRTNGQHVEYKGHFGAHLPRLFAARHVKKDTA